jgi:excisionase family DNA binding protein
MRKTEFERRALIAVSPSEAARMMGLGRTKLYELLSANELKSLKLGTRRLIRVSEIESFLDRLEDA